ncbi:MAG: Gliding motility regulatory protein [Pelotomaculum sp. PtaB.Bin013]|uniref:Stage 0 sporulation protein A homolog n=1 Tax=Pelotomaculum isophthalicicum JI TaxID=947010 RepID=A0A9X4H6D0_9FIRM|nr:hybrid sensor histidine kinase/response regulator [Pelotomaculum isophthalicicum]MDF9409182.1 hybrid sensor histidine kinase/response regulator [Pelotomaculum isophthalicicum JI]OPX90675.1 MAG: Gliding motility regulatory protein [Pelotomaculum sp. PtaB.Bin013]
MPMQDNKKDNDLLKRLRSLFKIEAEERLKAMSAGLLELEKTPDAESQNAVVEAIFREAHSLKGAARAVNMTDIETICQSLESVLAVLKRKAINPSPGLFDKLHNAVDTINKLLSTAEGGQVLITTLIQQLADLETGKQSGSTQTEEHLPKLKRNIPTAQPGNNYFLSPIIGNDTAGQAEPSIVDKQVVSGTVRISTEKLDSLLLQAEEMLSIKLTMDRHAADLRNIQDILGYWDKECDKNHPGMQTDKNNLQFDKLMEFLDRNQNCLRLLESKVKTMIKLAEHDRRSIGAVVDNFQKDIRKALMLPFSSLLSTFPMMIRDLSRAQNKEVELILHGSEIEIDKRILEDIKDPFIHLLRNCIDHGIETPEERERSKKARCGKITVTISQLSGHKVEILVSDDGIGINLDRVIESAINKGILTEKECDKLSKQEALALIFQSEVSTSPIITDISGRGLGLAIVREKVEQLGGVITVETQPQNGSSFRMIIPVTLATFRGILVRVSEQLFIIPSINVDKVTRIKQDEIKTIENKEIISLKGCAFSFVRLADVLELALQENKNNSLGYIPVLLLGTAEKRIAFAVDEIVCEQEVLVKSLGKQLSRVRNISGATVLGSGKVVPVLNVPDLLRSTIKIKNATFETASATGIAGLNKKSILVVEDSITSRMLLKNILESSGYSVKTAVDGIEALTALKTEDYDLVVSDVEMPRMNGFELTSRIRMDKKYAWLPVVLVTGLDSREDRERGIDAGADAYIVKSSFDHGNLLEVINKLI